MLDRQRGPALYVAASIIIGSCMALPSPDPTKFSNLDPSLRQSRRYQSLPDMADIMRNDENQRRFKEWDFDSWATKLRAMRENKAHRKSDSHLELQIGSPRAESNKNHKSKHIKREASTTSIQNTFQRLIELPLWQTSLLSAKYVMNHESDVVTYRERTFPTARQGQLTQAHNHISVYIVEWVALCI
jgi:hypothetical protein